MRIDAESLTLHLGGRKVLDSVSLSLGGGELVGLVGPNGAGKTSLLRALALLVEPTSGQVTYDGAAAESVPGQERACEIAYLAQNAPVHWPLTVERIVELGRLPHRGRFDAARDAEAVNAALRAAGAEDLRHRTADTLSGGERTRVLLARALAVEAPILLADEPGQALDPYHQLGMMELLQTQARNGTGVLVVLHDLALACRYCDRLVLLAEGRKIGDGNPREVLNDRDLERAYRIKALRGSHEGRFFVLPWSKIGPPTEDAPQ
jgi:iron complex transport system ATP-binding protein